MSLKSYRVNKNLTQDEAAAQLGISRAALARYETGRGFPNVPLIQKIEQLYGISFVDIDFMHDRESDSTETS